MKATCLTIIFIFLNLLSFSQSQKLDKNETAAKALVGSWRFDYAKYNVKYSGTATKGTTKIFHTDTIHFLANKTFKFRTHDTSNTDIRVHTGTWSITDKGKTLFHMNREAEPPFSAPSPNLRFPFKFINKNRIRIDYSVYTPGDTLKAQTTPVFFDRIK